MPKLKVDAVLFDMDGTLIDESRSYREAIRRTAELLLAEPVTMEEVDAIKRLPGFNNDWDATWALVGRRMHGVVTVPDEATRGSYAYRRMRNVFQTYYLGDRLWSEIGREEPPFAWAEPLILHETLLIALATLERLSRFTLGIATSRPRVEGLMGLRQHGLDRFFAADALVALEDCSTEKPHPGPLMELVRRVECRIPVYVGDTINDAIAAREAGIAFIHVGSEPFDDEQVEGTVQHRVRNVNDIEAVLGDDEE